MSDQITPERIAAQMAFVSPDLHQREIDQALTALDSLDDHQALVMASLELWSKRLRYSLELYQCAGDKHPANVAEGVRRSLARYTQIVQSAG